MIENTEWLRWWALCWVPSLQPYPRQTQKGFNLGSEENHAKLRALAKEILNDWDAVVAFVKNPGLPPTKNDAERVAIKIH